MKCPKCKGKRYFTVVTNRETHEHYHVKCDKCGGTGKATDEVLLGKLTEYEDIGTVEEIKRFVEFYLAIEAAFDCSAYGICFGYLAGSETENFKSMDELMNWYRLTKSEVVDEEF